MKVRQVKLTVQHQITIPKQVCKELRLEGGDLIEIVVMSGRKLLLKPKKVIDAQDPAYRLGREIFDAERQIRRGEVVPWEKVKRKHGL